MKALLEATQSSLSQIQFIIETLSTEQQHLCENIYADSGIGRHVRHVVDHFLALKNGLGKFYIDYDKRHRDSLIETDIEIATNCLVELQGWLLSLNNDNIHFVIKSEIHCEKQQVVKIFSNLERELLYLINHTIHHAAFIKLMAQQFEIMMPDEIGIAPGTASYFRQLATESLSNTLNNA